ncbi:hypothetical protein P12x_000527 [Tundrisphaera lichenicola]|uniref:hypothetical protein n=1 Tax=Tundrisphaera lichenicola TaxID=2029860 RepID=UPI003EBA84FA
MMRSILANLALPLAILAAQAVEAAESPDLLPPSIDGRPVEVAIGFYALDFARVTSREESFDVTGYLELSWRDPRLALPPGSDLKGGLPRRLDASQAWRPSYFFENALEQPRFHGEPTVEVDANGQVTSWAMVTGKFSSQMDLRRFPFDRQEVFVRIGSTEDVSRVRFVAKPELAIVGEEAFVTDWEIGQASSGVSLHRYVPGQDTYSIFFYKVELSRRSTFYLWRVMLPLTLLAIVSWAAFWFEPVGLQPQISTCMAALIALVAFNFAIDFSLPKVSYLTLIDKHALIGFGFVAISVVAVTLIHRAVVAGKLDRAKAIQRFVRWGFLPAYGICVALNLLY